MPFSRKHFTRKLLKSPKIRKGAKAPSLISILTYSSVKINMKLIRCIATVLLVIVAIEGVNGEFSNPTVYDIAKWICCIILICCLFLFNKHK